MSAYREVPECCLATVMTAHFPVWMFFSARCRAFAAFVPPVYCTCQAPGPFMDNTGGLSVVLLRDEFSAETLAKEKRKRVGLTQRALCGSLFVM